MSFTLVHQSKTKAVDSKTSTMPPKRSPSNHVNNLARNSHDSIIHLQHMIGNQSVQRLMSTKIAFNFANIRTKLKVSQPGDVYEQEADRVAEQVMQMSSTEPLARVTTTEDDKKINHKCKSCKDEEGEGEEKMIHRKTNDTDEYQIPKDVLPGIGNMGEGGLPLDVSTRTFMESRFGFDFSKVRIHTDEKAPNQHEILTPRPTQWEMILCLDPSSIHRQIHKGGNYLHMNL